MRWDTRAARAGRGEGPPIATPRAPPTTPCKGAREAQAGGRRARGATRANGGTPAARGTHAPSPPTPQARPPRGIERPAQSPGARPAAFGRPSASRPPDQCRRSRHGPRRGARADTRTNRTGLQDGYRRRVRPGFNSESAEQTPRHTHMYAQCIVLRSRSSARWDESGGSEQPRHETPPNYTSCF